MASQNQSRSSKINSSAQRLQAIEIIVSSDVPAGKCPAWHVRVSAPLPNGSLSLTVNFQPTAKSDFEGMNRKARVWSAPSWLCFWKQKAAWASTAILHMLATCSETKRRRAGGQSNTGSRSIAFIRRGKDEDLAP